MSKALFVSPDLLRPNPWNTNIVSPENERKLDEALKRFGLFKPIIVRETEDGLEIIGGEHRWESAKRLGYDEVPIFNLGPIDDKKAKEISLADNARYGVDDTIMLAELFGEIDSDELTKYLPYADTDVASVFSSVSIALDELEIDEAIEKSADIDESPIERAPKTHTIMRFKVTLADAERLTALIERAKKRHGFTSSDDLTNAGDALIHLLGASGDDDES